MWFRRLGNLILCCWKFDRNHGYTIKGVCNQSTLEEQHIHYPLMDIIKNKAVPLKVSLFAWQLFNKKVPIKEHLAQHKTLHLVSLVCMGGYRNQNTINHLFMECNFFLEYLVNYFAVVEDF